MNTYVENINDIIHETSVDFVLRPCAREIHIVQYDKSLPIIKVNLYREGQPYQLPTNATVHVRLGKLDHTFVYANILGMNEDRTIAYFAVSEQMAMIAGRVSPVIEVVYQGKVACSSPIPFVIDRNPVQEGQIESHDEFPVIYQLESDVAENSDWIRRYTALTMFDGFVEGESVWDDISEGETKYCQSGSQTEDVPGENTVIKIDLSQQHLSKSESKAVYIKKITINYIPDGQEEEETYEYTFGSRIWGDGDARDTIGPEYADLEDNNSGVTLRWYLNYLLAEGVSKYFGAYNGTKGQQFGSNSNPSSLVSLSTSSLENCTVTSIYVEVSSNSGTQAKVKLTLVNDIWTCNDDPDPEISGSNIEYEFLHEPNGTHLGSSSGGQVIHHYNHVFLKKENNRVTEVQPDPSLQYVLNDYSDTYKYSNDDNLLHKVGGGASFEVLSKTEVSYDSEENVTYMTFPKNIMPKVMYLDDTNALLYFDYVNKKVYDNQGDELQYDYIQCVDGNIVVSLSGDYSISSDYDYISYDVFDGYDNPLRHTSLQINWYEVYHMQDIYATQDYVDEEIAYALTAVYKPKGSSTVSNLNTISKSSAMSGDVYNMSDSGSLTNQDSSTIAVLSGDNVVFCWNNGSWYWDKMAATVDLSNYVDLTTDQTLSSTKTFTNGKELRFQALNAANYFYLKGDGNYLHIGAYGVATSLCLDNYLTKFIPQSNSQDLGSSTYLWQHIFLSGAVNLKGVSNTWNILADQSYDVVRLQKAGTNLITVDNAGHIMTNNSGCLGTSGNPWKSLFLSHYFYIGTHTMLFKDSSNRICITGQNDSTLVKFGITETYFANHIEPDADNTYDIGRISGSNARWRNLYLSGVISDGTNSVTVSDIVSKSYLATSTLWVTKTFNSSGEFTVDMSVDGTPNGLYYVTYGHIQAFIVLNSLEIQNLQATDAIRTSIPMIFNGAAYPGILKITKSGNVLTFKVASPNVGNVTGNYECKIYKTNLM